MEQLKNTNLRSQFLLNPKIIFLNFGSFGACPKPIFEDYHKWQLEMEREPVQFITVKGYQYLKTIKRSEAFYIFDPSPSPIKLRLFTISEDLFV